MFCRPGARCGRWRECPACGAARQARIAATADRLLASVDDVRLYTIRPKEPGAIPLRNARRAWLRASSAPAGIWTVESSPDGACLHLHALAPADILPAIRGVWLLQSDRVRSVRAAAAYMSKPRSAPHPEDYDGRLWGAYGPMSYWLLHHSSPPIVQGAVVENLLRSRELDASSTAAPPATAPTTPANQLFEPSAEPGSMEEFARAARRHLPNLYALADRRDLTANSQQDDTIV